jgi:hypothetical protein
LQAFAEAVSSASDLELAAWQEAGLVEPRSRTGVLLWSIVVLSIGAGGVMLALCGWFLVRPTLGLMPAVMSGHRTTQRAGLIIILSVMVALVAGSAAAFATFQGMSRVVFDALGHPAERRRR